ncbi:MAG TPA: phosphatase PAP2 family protein [Chloroflexota bacterium]|nr:phosphatase PAP2 family protein [Chloroflexota bacterium]
MNLRVVTFLGGPVVRAAATGEGALLLLLQGRYRRAVLLLASVGLTGGLNTLLKKLVDRRRPRTFFGTLHKSSSFPSGHSSGAAALSACTSVLAWQATRNRVVTGVISLLGAGWAGLVGYSRVRLHQHHVGDVLAGYALGCLVTAAAALFIGRELEPRRSPVSRRSEQSGSG